MIIYFQKSPSLVLMANQHTYVNQSYDKPYQPIPKIYVNSLFHRFSLSNNNSSSLLSLKKYSSFTLYILLEHSPSFSLELYSPSLTTMKKILRFLSFNLFIYLNYVDFACLDYFCHLSMTNLLCYT